MKSSFTGLRRKSGFTLIELLAVVALVIFLAAILLPAMNRMRANANAVRCASNLRQISMATRVFCAEHDGAFPYAYDNDPVTGTWLYWTQNISKSGMSQEYDTSNQAWYHSVKEKNVFNCPEIAQAYYNYRKANPGFSDYNSTYICNNNVIAAYPNVVRMANVKYPARTPMFADGKLPGTPGYQMVFYQAFGIDLNDPGCVLGSYHNGGGNVLFVDGHVERLTKNSSISSFIFNPLTSP